MFLVGGAGALVAGASVALGPAWISPTVEAAVYLAGGAAALALGLAITLRVTERSAMPPAAGSPRRPARPSLPRAGGSRSAGLPAAPVRRPPLPVASSAMEGPAERLWRTLEADAEGFVLPEIIGPVPETAYTASSGRGPFADRAPELVLGLGAEEAQRTETARAAPARSSLDGRPRFDLAEFLDSPLGVEALNATPPHLRHTPHSPHRGKPDPASDGPVGASAPRVPSGARLGVGPSPQHDAPYGEGQGGVWTAGGELEVGTGPRPMSHRAVLLNYEPPHRAPPISSAPAACPCRDHYTPPRPIV